MQKEIIFFDMDNVLVDFQSGLNKIPAKISAQIERYAIRMEQSDSLRLRKANRIKTIHSSLAIEGNNLSGGLEDGQ